MDHHNSSMVSTISHDKNMTGQCRKVFILSKLFFSIASEKQPDSDNKNNIAFGRSDWLHEFKLSSGWIKTTERYVPEIYYPKEIFDKLTLESKKLQQLSFFKFLKVHCGDRR